MVPHPLSKSLRQPVLDWLRQNVPEKRLDHILRVETMAMTLARHHGLDLAAVQAAGLMHDLAKCFPARRLLAMATTAGWQIDPAERQSPHLLHAPVGALIARETFGVEDERVLQAIANHTLGAPDMDAVSSVVYLADSLEPGRGTTPELQRLRQLSYEHLPTAVYETCVASLKYLLETSYPIHPRAILTRNAFLLAKQHCYSSHQLH